MMMLKLTALRRVLLFVIVVSLLLCCTVNIKAQSSSNSHLAVNVENEIKTTPNKNEEEIKRTAENVQAAGKNVEDFYTKFEDNIFGILKEINSLDEKITNAQKMFLDQFRDKKTDEIKAEINELEQNLNGAKQKSNEFKTLMDSALTKNREETETKVKKLIKSISDLKSFITSDDKNTGGKDSINLNKATEINKLANDVKDLAKGTLEEVSKHESNVSSFVEKLSEILDKIDLTISSSIRKQQQFENIIDALHKLQALFASFTAEAKKIQAEFKNINDDANTLHELCEKLVLKTNELVQKLQRQKNDKGKNNQTQENGTASSSDSSGVVVTHFIVFFSCFYFTMCGAFVIEDVYNVNIKK